MEKPVLVIMAAGMGSRYGGLKQIDPVDQDGHIIIDFSLFDAKRAGFETVIFIIKKETEKDFKEAIGYRMEKIMNVQYAYQELDKIPTSFTVPSERVKPWGTAHAIYCCKDLIKGPFAVINADDYYGVESFQMIYDYLSNHQDDDKLRYTMVSYQIENTLTENGTVARGVCVVNEDNMLVNITERTKIKKTVMGAAYTEDDTQWIDLPAKTPVSMNLWGFSKSIMREIENGMHFFLNEGLNANPLKCEYFIPSVVSRLVETNRATVEVLTTKEQWFGVTYKEDKPIVMKAIQEMKNKGIYPQKLWGENNE
ncbi:MAG: sugar phosphate nucleotidyltransferase [Coprobacillus sp.]